MEPIRPGVYRHFKGNLYAYCSPPSTARPGKISWSIRLSTGEQGYWVRPAAMWLETINRDGYTGPRFTWVEL